MWNRRKPGTARGHAAPAAAPGPVAVLDPVSLLESYFPGAIEEHPAKRRIRRANQLAHEMRQTGGRHRLEA